MKTKMIIVDGNSLLFRAFYATYNPYTPIMRTKDGVPTNALFAFSNMINKIVNDFKDDEHILVVFDTGKKTFRHEELETYKANRKPLPEDLKPQMPLAREYLNAMGIFTYEWEGYEGDDLAGSAAKLAAKNGYDVTLYTSDRDFLQLIDDDITVNLLKKGMSEIQVMNKEELWNTYELTPNQITDFKGLMGDPSDNLKGIPGVGQKTAVKLIKQFGTLEDIIAASANMKGKVYESIIANQEEGRMCKHIASIKIDLELPFSLDDTLYCGYDFSKIIDILCTIWIKTTSKSSQLSPKQRKKENDIINVEIVNRFPQSLNVNSLSLAIASNGEYNEAQVFGIAYAIGENTYFETIGDIKKDELLLKVLKDPSIQKYAYDYKAIKVALKMEGIELDGLSFDLLIAAYLLDSSLTNNPQSILSFFGKELKAQESINLLDEYDYEITGYLAHYVSSLHDSVIQSLKKADSLSLFEDIEIPLVTTLSDMEIEGFPLNKETLLSIGNDFKDKLQIISKDIFELAGETFNISSPKQVGEILFNKLQFPSPTKKLSTSVEVLKKIEHQHPIVNKILDYRKYAKLISTYVDGMINHIHDDGKLHPMYNQAQTTTGRLSSSNPNIQNISIRDEEGKSIRKAFFYEDENYEILSFDYSQVELRILASLSNCQKLIDAFNNNDDIHSLTAKYIFKKDEITADERRKAKTVNFGIVYGISEWGLAEQLEITPMEARQIIKSFYETYPEILQFMSNVAHEAETNGYAKTMLGRIRYIREFHDSNFQIREFARRAAINAPIQGTAADIIKIAMINVEKKLKDNNLKTCIICQIHDELVFKVPKEELEIASKIIKYEMENAYPLKCKLSVDGSHGRTWFDAK